MFANTQGDSMNFGFPDVCLTPTPAGPFPLPYPNISTSAMGVPPVANVLFDGNKITSVQHIDRSPIVPLDTVAK